MAGSSVAVQERPPRGRLLAAGGAGAERRGRREDDQEEPGHGVVQHRTQPATEA